MFGTIGTDTAALLILLLGLLALTVQSPRQVLESFLVPNNQQSVPITSLYQQAKPVPYALLMLSQRKPHATLNHSSQSH